MSLSITFAVIAFWSAANAADFVSAAKAREHRSAQIRPENRGKSFMVGGSRTETLRVCPLKNELKWKSRTRRAAFVLDKHFPPKQKRRHEVAFPMKTPAARLAGAVILMLLLPPVLRAQTGSGTGAAVLNDPGIMTAGRKLPPDVFDPKGKPTVVIFASRDMADWFYVDVFKQAVIIDDNFRKAGVNTLFYYANYFQEGIPQVLADRSSQFKFPIETIRMDDATARWGLKATPLMVV